MRKKIKTDTDVKSAPEGAGFAALGNKKELLPLKSLGFTLFDCKNLQEAEDLLEDLSKRDFGLVVITEDIAENNQYAFLKIVKRFPLAVLVLPRFGGRKNFAKKIVKEITKTAVGF